MKQHDMFWERTAGTVKGEVAERGEKGVSIDDKKEKSDHDVLGNCAKKLRHQRSIGICIGFQSRIRSVFLKMDLEQHGECIAM